MRRILVHLLTCALMTATTQAIAQPKAEPNRAERAQALFDVGLKFMDQGDYVHACPLLEQSETLDPGMGTRFRLAECYEGMGRTASAWVLFNNVADAAKFAQSPDRERVARQRAAALEPKLPRLVISVPARISTVIGFEVRWDGKAVTRDRWGVPRPVDPGEHKLEAVAPGKKPWEQTVKIDKPGSTTEVQVPEELEDAPKVETPPPPNPKEKDKPEEKPGPPWPVQRIAAVGAAGVGVVGLVVGTAFGVKASSEWDDATSRCTGGAYDRCTSAAIGLGDDASTSAAISTVGFVIGVAGLGAGAVLWFTAPPFEEAPATPAKAGWQLAPAVGPSGAGGVLRGRF